MQFQEPVSFCPVTESIHLSVSLCLFPHVSLIISHSVPVCLALPFHSLYLSLCCSLSLCLIVSMSHPQSQCHHLSLSPSVSPFCLFLPVFMPLCLRLFTSLSHRASFPSKAPSVYLSKGVAAFFLILFSFEQLSNLWIYYYYLVF